MKKSKVLSSLFTFLFLWQIGHSQSISSKQLTKSSLNIISNNVDVFFYAGRYTDTIIHVVWENYDPQNIKEVILEKSLNGTDFTFLSKAVVSALPDIYLYNYPPGYDYYNHIQLSTEHEGVARFLYNDIIKNQDLRNQPVWYRAQMISYSGQIYFSQAVNSLSEKTKNELTQIIADKPNTKNGQYEPVQGGAKAACPPIGTPNSGYLSTGITQTFYGTCCYWTETQYEATGPVMTNCGGNSYAWCCDTALVNTAGICTSGYASDPCCIHYCDQYAVCVCGGASAGNALWQCCTANQVTQWVVTSSVAYTAITISAAITNETCAGVHNGAITITVTNGTTPFTYTWSPNVGTTATISGLAAGTYAITVTDANGCTATGSYVVTTNALPTANAGPNKTICLGQSTLLSASGGASYQWSTGATTVSISVSPIVSTTYTVTVTSANGCTASDDAFVTVNPLPVANAGVDQTICRGNTATLTAGTGTSYLWNTGSSNSTINVSPNSTTTYTVIVTGSNGCTASDNVVVFVNPLPIANAGPDQSVCNGLSASLTATGGILYVWSNGAATSSTVVTPSATTNYTVTVSNINGCSATDAVTVTVHSLPNANAGLDLVICAGESVTLTANGGNSYQWSNGANTAATTVSPVTTTTYFVTATSTFGCTAADDITIFVNPLPTANAGVDHTICQGQTVTINASGGAAYLWDTGLGSSTLIVSPTTTTTYTVTVTAANGCTASDNVVVYVNTTPTANAGPDQTICVGQSASLVATGGSNYLWSTGSTNSAILVSPSSTTTYSVIAFSGNGCSASDDVIVTVNSIPVANAGSDETICLGQSVTLTSSGGLSYQWNTGATTATITVSPNSTLTYTVTVTNTVGCSSSDNVIVNVNPLPTANAGADQNICLGQSATLTASGSGSFIWSNGNVGTSITVSPASTSTYTLTVTGANGCSATDYATVYVNALPIAIAGSDQTICQGQSALLIASGGATYLWNTGSTLSSINVSPISTTTYSVTVTSGNGCTASDNITVFVNSLPVAYASADQTICAGTSTIVTASGGSSYTWNTGDNTAAISVSPSVTTTYIVTVTGSNGCTASDNAVVFVNSLPIAFAGPDQTICQGQSASISATGGPSYLWNTGLTSSSFSVTPSSTTTYTVTVTTNGCSASDNITVTIDAVPSAYAGVDQTICAGQSVLLTASGGITYAWSNGGNTASVNVSPLINTTYIVTVTNTAGCTATDNVIITVNTNPSAYAGADQTICLGQSATLTASGGILYLWNNGDNNSSVSVTPVATTTYTVTVSGANGCTASDNIVVSVDLLPTANAGSDQSICAGQTVTLSASGGGTYHWNTGANTGSTNVSPSASATYTVTVTNTSGCTAADDVIITVNPLPIANAGPDQNVCLNQLITLTATGGGTYIWNTGSTNSTINVTPTATITYTVTVTTNGCQATDAVTLFINPSAIADAGPDQTICPGQTAVLSTTTAGSYLWSNGMTTQSISVSPVSTTTYTVTVSGGGCSSSDEVVVNIASLLSVNAGPDQVICFGQTVTITASGGSTYLWSNGSTSNSINVSPAITTIYTVTASSGSCSATDNVVITVNPLPVADAGADQIICQSGSSLITATGGISYLWSNGSASPSQIVSPIATTSYYVTVTNASGCTASDFVTINVNTIPIANAGPDITICQGQSTTLNASGGTNYSWSNGQTTSSILVSPISTTIYTVTVTSNGCSASDNAVVNVLLLPVANAGIDQTICYGQTATLTATGGASYQWNNGSTNSSINVSPIVSSTTYTVTVTSSNGCTASDNVQVNVNSMASANAGPDQTICQGISTTVTATGGSSYIWNNGNSASTFVVVPFVTTTFTVTVSDLNGCTASDDLIINISALPVANAGPDQIICNGQTATLTAGGGANYIWSNGSSTNSINVSPIATTTYTVTVTSGNGCTASDNVIAVVNPLPTANAGPDQSICQGSTATLTASAGSNYLWSTGQTLSSINVTPAFTIAYTVTVFSSNGCSASDNININVTVIPIANAGVDQVICNGSSSTLTATGGATYLWSNGAVTSSIIVTPSSTTTYNVTATSNGCTASDNITVTVNPIPTADAGPNQTICQGQSANLTASGGTVYQWSNGANTASIAVIPTSTTNYIVTVTDSYGCTAADNITVFVNAIPIANAGVDQTICQGQSSTLTASGGSSYLWNTGMGASTLLVSPSSNTTYTVTVTGSNGCTASDNVVVFVNATITASAGADQTICQGQSASLFASGGSIFQWSTGATSASIIVSPSSSTTYTVTVSNSNGCSATDNVLVIVDPIPSANAGSDVSICQGQSATLTASGGSSYQWNTGAVTSTITVSPSTTSTYTVTVIDGSGCNSSDNVTVYVNPLPVADAGADQMICQGETATLTGSGIGSYIWSTGSVTNSINVSPSSTSTYTLTITSSGGCSATDNVTVYVNALPVANAGNDQTICQGQLASLQASGGASYLWNTGAISASTSVSPASSTTYTVTVTSGNGCTASDNVTVFVNPLPVAYASADQTICSGASTIITASGGSSYIWNTGDNTASIAVSPIINTTYFVTVTSSNGCTASDDVVVFVNNVPSAFAGPDQTICQGLSASLSATGGASYQWNTGQTTSSINVSPVSTTTYTVTVTSNGCSASDNVIINVNSLPTANAGPAQTVCLGQTVSLTASGGSTYAWSNGGNTASISVSPIQNTSYYVTVTNAAGCSAVDIVVVNVNSVPSAFAGADQSICEGQNTTLSASGGIFYLWDSGANTPTVAVFPLTTTTYLVTVTDINGCTASDNVVVIVNSIPTANAGIDLTICQGQIATLTASGGGSYLWNIGATSSSLNISPAATTTYTVTVTIGNGCTSSDNVTVIVNPLPVANAGIDQTICFGQTATISATGGATYIWNTGSTNSTINVTPSGTTTYTVTITSGNGCQATDDVTIFVNALPIPDAGPDQTICPGQTTILSTISTGSYQWSNGMTTQSISVSPAVTTTYTLTISNGGCSSSDDVVVNVGTFLTVNAGVDQTICNGQTVTLTASGGSTYLWSNGNTSNSINVSPAVTTIYTVTASSGSCSATDNVMVTVNPLPVADAGTDQTLCLGSFATITATGGTSYLWSNGSGSSTQIVSPLVTTTYYVTVTNANGCSASDLVTITVNGVPLANAGPDFTICQGQSSTLNASGGSSYSWSTGQTTASILVTPLSTTTYTVTVTSSGCSSTDNAVVNVLLLPVANAGQDQTICYGQTTTLTATGGATYQWNTGSSSSTINITPSGTFTYTVTVTSSNGCTASDDVVVNVNSMASANAGPDQTICQGQSATLTASGGTSYIWNNGSSASSFVVVPLITTTFTVTISDLNGCTASDDVTINVNALPVANAGPDQTICNGQTATLIASGGAGYLWSNGGTTSLINVSPSSTLTYSVTVTSGNGCTASDNVIVTVNSLPLASAGIDQTICLGQTATLTASGGTTYQWNTGSSGSVINVTPTVTSTYTVTVTSGNGCQATDDVTIFVNALPIPDAGPDQTICQGQSATLMANGGVSYIWNNGTSTSSFIIVPVSTTTFTVTVSDINGCSASDNVTINVNSAPIASAGPDQIICEGQSVALTASGGVNYQWNTGANTSSINVSPVSTTTYTVTVIGSNGCSASDNVIVTVNSLPLANAGIDQIICLGQTATITASGGGTYQWNTGGSGSIINVTPSLTTTYTVTVISSIGCQATDDVIIYVNPLVIADTGPDQTICPGQTAVLSTLIIGTYQWSNGMTTQSISVSPALTTTYTLTITSGGCSSSDEVVVNVAPFLVADAGIDQTICNGQTATLTASGGAIYLWSNGSTSNSINVSPVTTTTYTVTASSGSCSATDLVVVAVNPNPIADAGTDQIICEGSIATISASGGTTYLWNNGSVLSSQQVTPLFTTIYVVTVTNANGCTASDLVTINVNSVPIANAGPDISICLGQTATISASGGTSYSWSNGQSTSSIAVAPISTATYTVTITDPNGCSATDDAVVSVSFLPVANAGSDQTICLGQVATLTATGGLTYLWNDGSVSNTINVSPTMSSTTFSVTVTNSNNCTASDAVVVNVNPLPVANAGPDQTICQGQSATLTANGGSTYIWNTGANTSTLFVIPLVTTTFTVTVSDNNGCSASEEVIVNVAAFLTANAGADQTICEGQTATLTASGGSNYQWSNGSTSNSINVTPSLTTIYTVTVSSGSCSATDNVVVTVNPLPIADAGTDQTICEGGQVTISATGGTTYLWSNGSVSSSQIVSPAVTTNYIVTVTTVYGCTASDLVTINVNVVPLANAGPDQTICVGQTATLTASGGATYSWNTGQTMASILVAPITATTYTVTVTSNNGCSATDNILVNVSTIPVANAGPDQSVCLGQAATLTATGGATYLWNNGLINSTISVSPTAPSTIYTVTVTNINGCTASDDVVVNINSLPLADAGPDQIICENQSATLTGNGGNSYIWDNGAITSSINVAPATTSIFTVTVTDLNGCSASDDVTVNVNSAPIADAGVDQIICEGQTATLMASGGSSYLWSTGSVFTSINVLPLFTTSYTVTVTGGNGCSASDVVTVFVNHLPLADAGVDQAICQGNTATLIASGGSSYIWNSGLTAATIFVSPAVTTTYSVTVTNSYGCSATDEVIVTVNTLPIANAGIDQTICSGSSATLTATGGTAYIWSTGSTINPIVVTPFSSSSYNVTVSNGNGCSATDLVSVFVVPLPIANAGPDNTLCYGQSAILTASGGQFYQWSNGVTSGSQNVTPYTTTTYTVTVMNSSGCTASDDVIVNVNPVPLAEAGVDQTICQGQMAFLTASGGSSYLWNTGIVTPTLVVAPLTNTTYTVTVTNNSGCMGTDSVNVIISPNPLIFIAPNAPIICIGGSVQLTASGANTYSWSPPTGLNTTTGPVVIASPTTTTTYIVTATDIAGCSETSSVVVTIGTGLLVSVTPASASVCLGSSVQLSASGATNYTWSPGNGLSSTSGTTVIATPTVPTTYTVIGSDLVGCSGSTSVNVNVEIVNASATSTDENCGQANGSLTVNPVGTCTQGFTYVWSTVPPQTNQTITNIAAGIYTVTVTCGACFTTVTDTVHSISAAALTISNIVNTSCGMANGSATVNVTGGTSPYTYQWSNGQTTPVLVNAAAGIYNVFVFDNAGCISTTSVTIAPSTNIITSNSTTNADCNVANGSAAINVIQGSGNYTYLWSTNPAQTTPTVTGLFSGIYTITVSDSLCTIIDTVFVPSNPGPAANFSLYPSVMTIDNGLVHFTDLSSSSVVGWQWNFGDGSLTSSVQDPTHIFDSLGTFYITLLVTDGNGCTDIHLDSVKVLETFTYYIPNTFTPNADGINDLWLPKGLGIDPKRYHLEIYNRWGNIVFETDDPYEGWDGTFMNRGEPEKDAMMEVYVYRIRFRDKNDQKHDYFGHINLIP